MKRKVLYLLCANAPGGGLFNKNFPLVLHFIKLKLKCSNIAAGLQ